MWGFSDGEHAYIYYEKEFYKIDMSPNEVFFHAKHQPSNGAATAAIPAGVMGGAIGGALAGGIAALASKVYKLKSIHKDV